MTKIVEFLLWDNCNNHCKFCFLKNKNKLNSFIEDDEKARAIQCANTYLNGDRFIHGSDILLCGGELFDNKFNHNTHSEWYSFVDAIVEKVKIGTIGSVYVNTNLIYDINTELTGFLNKFFNAGILNKLNFTTSYDIVGRFKNKQDRQLFFNNIEELHRLYPALSIVVNIIMTSAVCDLILDGQFSISEFQNKHGVFVNLIPYIILTEDIAPSKEDVMNTLKYVGGDIPGYLDTYVKRFSIDHPRVLLKYYNGCLNEVTTENNTCGHSVNFSKYTKDGSCFICDILKLASGSML